MKFYVRIHKNGSLNLRPYTFKELDMTAEKAAHLGPGDKPYHANSCALAVGPRSKAEERVDYWRVSGKVKLWKTRPGDFRTPLRKGGAYSRGNEITPFHLDFHRPGDCPLRAILQDKSADRFGAYDRKQVVRIVTEALVRYPTGYFDRYEKTKEGLPIGEHVLDLEALLTGDDAPVNGPERQAEKLTGEHGPPTLDDSFLAPGQAELDSRSQFREIYRANSEEGGGPTREWYESYAATKYGEVVTREADEEAQMLLARIVSDGVAVSTNTGKIGADARKLLTTGLQVDWDFVRKQAHRNLVEQGFRESRLSAALEERDGVIYRLEEEADNNLHGGHPHVHLCAVGGADLPDHREFGPFTTICGREAQEDGSLLWVSVARYKRFGMPPFSPVCPECEDGLGYLESKREDWTDGPKCACEIIRAFVRMSVFDPPDKRGYGDPSPAWDCPVHGPVHDMSADLASEYGVSAARYEAHRTFFLRVAQSGPIALSDKDASEWASTMANAELLRLRAEREDSPQRLTVEYDDLLGACTALDDVTGRFAVLEPELCDSWARYVKGEERRRVLLALVFDRFLHNPDAEGGPETAI